ncbi:MAG: glycosyltransferase family 2 protein [Pseudomonadota bacterium]|nr:glycosyltransferase family 2 protein [Pseudomonadota bacterium]
MSLCVSVVSHGHGNEALRLLAQLAASGPGCPQRVVLTLNVPEPALTQALQAAGDRQPWPFVLDIVENPRPQGFGTNHNLAFALDTRRGASEWFAVLNPDLTLGQDTLPALRQAAAQSDARTGLIYPVQVDAHGRRQDHERLLPTPARLLRRHLPGAPRREVRSTEAPDWVNAAFMLLRREAYASIGGFDEQYHMYCEDVDLCLRLRLAGWRLVRADGAVVAHGARRASRRHPRHLLWHVQSLLRLWRSRAWQAWRAGGVGETTTFDDTTQHHP